MNILLEIKIYCKSPRAYAILMAHRCQLVTGLNLTSRGMGNWTPSQWDKWMLLLCKYVPKFENHLMAFLTSVKKQNDIADLYPVNQN